MRGITITLYNKTQTGVDAFGRAVFEETPELIDNVLVGTPSTQEIIDTLNLTGKRIAYVMGIPKGDTHTWTDRKVEFFGETFHTFGEPTKGIENLIPLSWGQNVMVERYE